MKEYTSPELVQVGSALSVIQNTGTGDKGSATADSINPLRCFVNEPDE
jgi:hypothetical protein